ncbi:PaaI family thioesterase [Paenarthrobacter nitroguajacolicus]|uniref:PaaI family thioesterase n=1 Tax=Paenarthrobacter nitroguajacolicus TaxID=211146 RepID=A0A558GN79_PAENT|nr:PaaI family thioesterase [Paenarthrobacter nitroguajacolicus]TVU58351.1 PaaI family thioesterase [Paenarthrobacter nitroguajacolicus]
MTTDPSTQRSETFTWIDPAIALEKLPRLSGMDYFSGLREGSIAPPPIASLMKFDLVDARFGHVEFQCWPGEAHYNPLGMVHGGLACTLLDTVLGCAAHTTLDAGIGYTSIDLAVKYLRPITLQKDALHAEGSVVKAGPRAIFTEGRLSTTDGKLLATATSTLLVFPHQPGGK